MRRKSLKNNFIMYFIRAFANFCFILLTFPYIARRIGVEGIGKIQYIETINTYFVLFINLGILTYGEREVAQSRENSIKLNNLINELFSILSITTLLGSLLYIMVIIFTQNKVEKLLLCIYFIFIILNFCSFEWVYIGVENQEYITKRDLAVKFISGILIFIFIKTPKDIYLYTLILVLAIAGSNVYNLINLRKFIKLRLVKVREFKHHLKPLLYLFSATLATTVAYNLDSLMIKKIVGDIELGYYTLAIKFGKLPLVIGGAMVAILPPRLSYLMSEKKETEYYKLWNNGISIMSLFYIPGFIGSWLLSESMVLVLGGSNFLPAISIFKVFSLYIVVMGFAISTGVVLITHKKDKEYFISVVLGSILNILFNILLIPRIGALGASIATVVTEIVAIITRLFMCKNIFKSIKFLNVNILKILISSLGMGIVVFYITRKINCPLEKVLLSGIIGGILYFLGLFLLKEELTIAVLDKIKSIKSNRKNFNIK